MRGPGETDEQAVTGSPGPALARGLAGPSPESALTNSLAAARAGLPPGGKAAARLHAFMERRGLNATGDRGAESAAPHIVRLEARRARPSISTTYQQALSSPGAPQALLGDRAPGAVPWRFLGPRWIPKGQTYGGGSGATPAVAGRVAAIAVDPTDSRHVLVGSAGGGVWETRNQGLTWAARTDHQPSLGIGALAFDPSDASHVFAGTGEGNSLEVPGQGLLRSTDGGTTWTLIAQATFAGDFFYRLVVDPHDGNCLFAATDSGVFRSLDRASTWTQVRAGLSWDISLSRPPGLGGGGRELFAACVDGLQRSLDDGATWSRAALPGQPADFANVVGRMAVASAPSDPGTVYVFAARESAVWLWRRSAFGGAFARVTLPSLDPPGRGSPGYGISQSWYDWCIAVAPDDRDTVFLGAVDAFRGRRSAAGTWSWQDISSRTGADSMHPDQHTVVFDPSAPHVLYFGNDGGIFRSPDAGDSWQSLNKGLGITEFEYLAQHPRNRTWILGGTQDNGTLRNRGNGIWDQVALGDGGDCATEGSSPKTCYHSYYGMAIERSRSGGDTWTDVSPPVSETYNALFYPPLEANGKTLAKAGTSLFISDNEGDSWTEVALPGGDLATAMTFATGTRLLVGCRHGGLSRVDRSAAGWGPPQPLTSPRGAYISDLLAQPTGPYWASYSTLNGGHVYRSVDDGATWQDATGDLPDVPVSAIEADPTAPNTIWIATDIGVFRSTDLGNHWTPFGDGLPRALAVDLAFHAKLRLLRVGTRSRGVWEIAVP